MSEYSDFCKQFTIGEKILYYGEIFVILDISDIADGFAQCLLGINEAQEIHSRQWLHNDGVQKYKRE